MAKKTKFTFTHEDGRVSTRSSEGRTYTHVVLTRVDVVALRAQCDTPAYRKHDGKDWDFFVSPQAQGRYDKIVAEHKTKEAYVAAKAASRLAWVNKNHGEGDIGREHVAQWSMSEANARKARPAGTYASIRVAPVDPQPGEGWEPCPIDPTGEKKDAALFAARRARK